MLRNRFAHAASCSVSSAAVTCFKQLSTPRGRSPDPFAALLQPPLVAPPHIHRRWLALLFVTVDSLMDTLTPGDLTTTAELMTATGPALPGGFGSRFLAATQNYLQVGDPDPKLPTCGFWDLLVQRLYLFRS